MPAGRPTSYNLDIARRICARLSEGELLIDICADKAMPGRSTVYLWTEKHPEFMAMFGRARAEQAHAIAERAFSEGNTATAENAQAARVRFDAGRWFASRVLPKEYGDRVDVKHGGQIGLTPIPIDLDQLDDDQRDTLQDILLTFQRPAITHQGDE